MIARRSRQRYAQPSPRGPIAHARVRTLTIALLCVAMSACKVESALQPGGSAAGNAASVQIALRNASIAKGATTVATAIVRDGVGNQLPATQVVWSTTPMSVATIDDFGGLTGIAEGIAVVTATAEGKTGSAALTVTAGPAGTP